MSVIGSNILAGASGQGGDYTIARSLRLRSSASAKLTKTFGSNNNTSPWTLSMWVKRGQLGTVQTLFSRTSASTADTNEALYFDTSDRLRWIRRDNNLNVIYDLTSARVFRDPSAWYHVVVRRSTGTAFTVSITVNNTSIGASSSQTGSPSDISNGINSNVEHTIGYGSWFTDSGYFDGYITEVNFIDGTSPTASSFGANNASTGVWQPKKYAGTYGTNGFYLPFSDNASTTTLGSDFSGNGNNWTTNNISLTAGSTYDSMTDVPTLTSATASNYCVLSPLAGDVAPTNGNLYVTGVDKSTLGTIGVSSGKWYFEMTCVSNVSTSNNDGVGIATRGINSAAPDNVGYLYRSSGVKLQYGGSNTSYGASFTTGDVIGVAFDMDNGTLTFYKNNSSQGVAFTGITGTLLPVVYSRAISTTPTLALNFGQQPFIYAPPANHLALNTFNLPTPTIGATSSTLAEKYMDISLYSGTSASGKNITDGLSLSSGGLLWVKNRNATGNHALVDSVRGITKRLISDSTNAEDTISAVTSFNSNGFTLEGSDGSFNLSGRTYVAWQWLANGTGVSNTAGSITSTVSANTSAGFSVVTYTGTGANATVGHGLGVAPKFIIFKNRTTSSRNWICYHASLGATLFLELNTTAAQNTDATQFNNTAPTSTVFSVGSSTNTNQNTNGQVAYCFSEVAGYSKFGSYTGNGSTDGTFVYTGFRPKFVLIKRTSGGENWAIIDASRDTFNLSNKFLRPDESAEESTDGSVTMDLLSNGFKLRSTDTKSNASESTYIYMAIAETPAKFSLGR